MSARSPYGRPTTGGGVRPVAVKRRREGERGLTLLEVLIATAILAGAIMVLQLKANQALKSSVETNRKRAAKMLLLKKAEEVIAGVEEGSGGDFEGYPGFSWEVSEALVPLEEVEESVRSVTIAVFYPSLEQPLGYDEYGYAYEDDEYYEDERGTGVSYGATQDSPGELRVTVLLDPEDAELQPAAGMGQMQGPPGAGGGAGVK